MPEFVSVAKIEDIAPGQGRTVSVGTKKAAVFNIDGTFYAIDDTCLHRGGPLGEGVLEGHFVTCPWHGWKYDIRTGEMTMNPSARIGCYPARTEAGEIQVSC